MLDGVALLLAVAGTHADAGVSSVVGSPITSVRAIFLVHAVAGTHAFVGVFFLALLLLASMILFSPMMLLSSMLLQVFFLLPAQQFDVAVIHAVAGVFFLLPALQLLASMLFSLPMLLVAAMLLLVFLLLLALLLLALLHYECCSMVSFLLLWYVQEAHIIYFIWRCRFLNCSEEKGCMRDEGGTGM